jgi:hypothetical protein
MRNLLILILCFFCVAWSVIDNPTDLTGISVSGGTPRYDEILDPSNNTGISFNNFTNVWTTSLGATQFFRIDGSNDFVVQGDGNVGLGTTSPTGTLFIDGSADQTHFLLQANSTQTVNPFTAESSDSADKIVFTNTWTFSTVGSGIFGDNGQQSFLGTRGAIFNSAADTTTYGDFLIYGSALNPNFFSDSSTSRVGIGNTEPSTTLHVTGNTRITGLVSCDTIDTDGSGVLSCGTDGGGAGSTPRYDQILDAGTHAGLEFGAFTNTWTVTNADTAFFRIDASNDFVVRADGNVGIGSTDPSWSLDVTNEAKFEGGVMIAQDVDENAFGLGINYAGLILRPTSAAGGGGDEFVGMYVCTTETCTVPMFIFTAYPTASGHQLDFGGGGWDAYDPTEINFFVSPTATASGINQGLQRGMLVGNSGRITTYTVNDGDVLFGDIQDAHSDYASSAVYALKEATGTAAVKKVMGLRLIDYGVDLQIGEGPSLDWITPRQDGTIVTGGYIALRKTTGGESVAPVDFSFAKQDRTTNSVREFMQVDTDNIVIVNQELRAGLYNGTSTGNSGINYGSFTNVWTSSAGDNPFFRADTSTNDLYIRGDGNIGIGNSDPVSLIHADIGAGVGQFTLDGSSGGCLMMRDTDDAGWSECDFLNGVMTCSIDADGICD